MLRRKKQDQGSSTRGRMSSEVREVQKLPWEGCQMRVASQMAGVGWERGMPRVLQTSPPHREEYELFSWEWAFKPCSEGLERPGWMEQRGRGRFFRQLEQRREAIIYSFLDVF